MSGWISGWTNGWAGLVAGGADQAVITMTPDPLDLGTDASATVELSASRLIGVRVRLDGEIATVATMTSPLGWAGGGVRGRGWRGSRNHHYPHGWHVWCHIYRPRSCHGRRGPRDGVRRVPLRSNPHVGDRHGSGVELHLGDGGRGHVAEQRRDGGSQSAHTHPGPRHDDAGGRTRPSADPRDL